MCSASRWPHSCGTILYLLCHGISFYPSPCWTACVGSREQADGTGLLLRLREGSGNVPRISKVLRPEDGDYGGPRGHSIGFTSFYSQMFVNLHFLNQTIGELKRKGRMVEMRFCLVDDAMVRGREDDDVWGVYLFLHNSLHSSSFRNSHGLILS